MYLYFFTAVAPNDRVAAAQGQLKSLLDGSGVSLITNQPDSPALPAEVSVKLATSGQSMLDQMDALVIEATTPDPEVGYLLAHAVATRKPTLFLQFKGTTNPGPLAYLSDAKTKEYLIVRKYLPTELSALLTEFMGHLEAGGIPEIPSIKFTLRITPRIDRYLTWKSKRIKLTKADFLRQYIAEEMMKKDDDFRRGTGTPKNQSLSS